MSIKEKREEFNLSQAELAQKIGVTQSLISKWEKGIVYPRTKNYLKLTQIFNCSVDDLMKGVVVNR